MNDLGAHPHDPENGDDRRWARLLRWLHDRHGMDIKQGLLVESREVPGAGRGLFALKSCQPSTTLFTIPANALINSQTLAPIYPRKFRELTAVQQISLHLLLHKPHVENDSLDPTFGPYLSTFPRDFASHPLSWCILPKDNSAALLDSLPPGVRAALERLRARFENDWDAIRRFLRKAPSVLSTSSRSGFLEKCSNSMDSALPDYLWAWLNGRHRLTLCFTILTSWPSVNTRCIHYPVREPRTDEDNQTLCPILDFANHSENNSQIVPIINARSSVPKAGARQRSDDYRFVSCADSSIAKGQQLFLRYGGHANRTLFVEYGFVNHFEANAIIHGSFRGELDLQDSVEELLGKSLHDLHYPFIRRALEDEGYWGEWTLDSSPPPAHPSYRLITALRLLYLAEDTPAGSVTQRTLQPWRDVLTGRCDIISNDNESRWRSSLIVVCKSIIQRAGDGLHKVAPGPQEEGGLSWMWENIRILWQEELEVASAVVHSVQAGEEF